MKGIIFLDKQSVKCETLNDPEIIAPTDVIVKVRATAICGSDLHVYRGNEEGPDVGTVMGHEFSGEVIEAGSKVYRFSKGDQVISPFTTSCGTCYYCQIGLTCRCIRGMLYGMMSDGKGLHGGQAEYVRVPLADSTLLRYDDHIKPELALLAGDILSTAFFCAKQAEVRPDGTFAVIGCGPVGLMSIVAARELGARTVFAIDSVPERLRIAQSFGALALHMDELDPAEILENATNGIGVDAALEAVGSPEAAKLAYTVIRHGGIISTVGVHHSDHFAFSPIDAYDKNITYKIGRAPARYYMDRSLRLIEQNSYPLDAVLTHHFDLSEGAQAYRVFDQKLDGCIKPILVP